MRGQRLTSEIYAVREALFSGFAGLSRIRSSPAGRAAAGGSEPGPLRCLEQRPDHAADIRVRLRQVTCRLHRELPA